MTLETKTADNLSFFQKNGIVIRLTLLISTATGLLIFLLNTFVINRSSINIHENIKAVGQGITVAATSIVRQNFQNTKNLQDLKRKNILRVRLQKLVTESLQKSFGLYQIAIISSESSKYYLSTLKKYEGNKIAQGLDKSFLEKSNGLLSISELQIYSENKQIPAIQFLQNINIANGATKKVATIQILFRRDYSNAYFYSNQKYLLMLSLGAFLIIFVFVFFLSSQISKGIHSAQDGILKILHHQYDHKILISNDEVGVLTDSIQILSKKLGEKDRDQKQELKKKQEVTKKKKVIETVARRSTVAYFVCQIGGITEFCNNQKPEKVVKLIDLVFEKISKVIEGVSGYLDNYANKTFFVSFDGENSAERAIQLSKKINVVLDDISKEFHIPNSDKFITSIGIHVGDVVIGNLSSNTPLKLNVIGDVVDLTTQISRYADNNEILITKAVLDSLEKKLSTLEVSSLSWEGKEIPVYLISEGKNFSNQQVTQQKYEKKKKTVSRNEFDETSAIKRKIEETQLKNSKQEKERKKNVENQEEKIEASPKKEEDQGDEMEDLSQMLEETLEESAESLSKI